MTFEAQTANKAALAQAGKIIEGLPDLGFKKGKLYLYFEEGKITGVGIENANAPMERK